MSCRGRSASSSSNEPAHASRLVRNELRLKSRLIVAGTEVSSNWDVANGPRGSWKTLPRSTRGEISIAPGAKPEPSKVKRGTAGGGVAGAGYVARRLVRRDPFERRHNMVIVPAAVVVCHEQQRLLPLWPRPQRLVHIFQ